jgi:hypothetical protein
MLKKFIPQDSIWPIRGVLIFLTILFIGADVFIIKFLSQNEIEDVLNVQKISKDEASKASDYVKYIADTVNSRSYAAIDSKWVEDIPPFFKKNAKEKIESLNVKGFLIKRVGSDRKDIYVVECETRARDKDIVFFDVTKAKDGKLTVMKLVRIY